MSDYHNDQDTCGGMNFETHASKSAQKKQMRELQGIGEKLLTLSTARLAKLDLPEQLLKALREGRRLKRVDAVRRQIRYIAKLIKSANHESIVAALAKLDDEERLFRQRFQQVEALAERLSTGDPDLLEQVLAEHPSLERQRLRQLIRQCQKESVEAAQTLAPGNSSNADNKTSTAQRKLFDYLRENLSTS